MALQPRYCVARGQWGSLRRDRRLLSREGIEEAVVASGFGHGAEKESATSPLGDGRFLGRDEGEGRVPAALEVPGTKAKTSRRCRYVARG
jgi:hypothetical protein